MRKANQKQCLTYNLEAGNLSESTMYFIDAFNELAFSSNENVELLNINRSTNSCSERKDKSFSQYLKGKNVGWFKRNAVFKG